MNQRFDPNENRPANPTAWPADDAARADEAARTNPATMRPASGIDPVTAAPLGDPLAQRPLDPTAPVARTRRSNWPVLIILLAGLVLALLVWLPAEMSNDASDTATQPAPASETATPPAAQAPAATAPSTTTPPAATAPADTAPAAPATPPAATGTAPATGAAPATAQ
ncbi:hypothetical protein ASG25_04940 [Rhizobium sp. Leaf384]|uniref:hypothetical protein n=1 Tax=unclassified Rhizobium TaxID=2613769 RepID=UPI0007152055|nr:MULTISPECIES: hypothetical protein [unclassified Rhizobium]KQR77660.1 hypothetical protein ASG03_14775 [Rhizobium sp. Leaf341]KQS80876.1 hypothetical protein ASG25_04940 [Rhizobium sp. Leaf384]KQS86736.1 hypothetical protein ASG58_00240 [Rhizobium sp. Leaf383]